ncbi:hypothetical protein Ciccas_005905 [Cichlidogyrus casuarinus]|uniref:B30.2/SPRY domain-containing protein n=1 Tax=Cichlidogyrus casuarinus TaxID=1844966 RepID=A0ABD2Q7B4_9PLAT
MVFTRDEAVLIRADQPIPLCCGIYYFEVTVVNPGANGVCAFGYATNQAPSNKMLGYDKHSFGYQNNGYLSHDSVIQFRKNYLSFGEGKSVGFGIDFVNNCFFFTFDGELKGTEFQNKIPLSDNPKFYPSISIQSRNLKILVNLGQKPFKFDLKEHITKARQAQEKKILDCVNDESFTVNKMNQLVAKYLVHHGYVSTAKAFTKSTQQNDDIPGFSTMVERKRIKSLCQARLYGRVNTLLSEMFPLVVEKSPELMVQLRCRQLIEMMNRPESSSSRRKTRRNSSSSAVLEKSKQLEEDLASNLKEEDAFCLKYNTKKGIQVNGEECEENIMLKQIRFCRALVSYFEEVRDKLGKVSSETSHLLEQTISLLAYTKPDSPDCPFKNLLDPSWDIATASLVNSAILC